MSMIARCFGPIAIMVEGVDDDDNDVKVGEGGGWFGNKREQRAVQV